MMIKMRHLSFLFMVFLTITACTVGPDYHRPWSCVPSHYKEAKGKPVIGKPSKYWKIAEPRDAIDRGKWWEIFKDPKLNELEAMLNNNNQSIATAAANFRQACELANEARASYFPTVSASALVTRQKGSGGTSTFITNTPGGGATTGSATSGSLGFNIFTTHQYILNAIWEPDIWGLVRRTVEGAESGAQASAALLASTRLSSQASLAQFYFELRALDTDQKILNDTVAAYKKSLRLTLNQYKQGVAARSDVVQAQSQLETAQTQAIANRVNRATFEHAIAVLTGIPPACFSLPPNPLRHPPPPIPLEVPCALLERRPDVAQAERLMAQANAQIGVSVAAYYPTLTLSGIASVFARGGILTIPKLAWSYGPQLAETIYDAGLRAATVRAAEAGYDSTVASYRQTVLAAFQEVEDNLSSLRILAQEAIAANKAAASARHALTIVTNQYKAGTVAYTSVIVAQNAAYTAEKTAADITGLRMTAAIGLIKALGGGWDACCIADV